MIIILQKCGGSYSTVWFPFALPFTLHDCRRGRRAVAKGERGTVRVQGTGTDRHAHTRMGKSSSGWSSSLWLVR